MTADRLTLATAVLTTVLLSGLLSLTPPAHAQLSITSLPGITHFMPYAINGQPHFLAYNGATGQALFCRIHADGSTWTLLAQYQWERGPQTFMPYTVNGEPHFLTHGSDTGVARFIRILPDGGRYEIQATYGWDRGPQTFMPYTVDGEPYFLAFLPDTGLAHFIRILPDGGRYEIQATYGWDKGLQTFMPYTVNGEPHFLAYISGTGVARFIHILPDGGRYEIQTTYHWHWPDVWTDLASFTAYGEPYLLRYTHTCRGSEFPDCAHQVDISPITLAGELLPPVYAWTDPHPNVPSDPTWEQVLTFELNGQPWLLAYDASGHVWMLPMLEIWLLVR